MEHDGYIRFRFLIPLNENSYIHDNLITVTEAVVYRCTVENVSKYVVFSDPYFPVFVLNTGKYGSEKTTYLDTFHAVASSQMFSCGFYNCLWKKV